MNFLGICIYILLTIYYLYSWGTVEIDLKGNSNYLFITLIEKMNNKHLVFS